MRIIEDKMTQKLRTTNACVKHLKNYPDYAPAWEKSRVLYEKLSNADRKLTEACCIATKCNTNSSRGRFAVSQFPAKLVMAHISKHAAPPVL